MMRLWEAQARLEPRRGGLAAGARAPREVEALTMRHLPIATSTPARQRS